MPAMETFPRQQQQQLFTSPTPTLNKMGFMFDLTDDYVREFTQYAGSARGTIADLGCAFGATTRRLLQAGATEVLANDLSSDHLAVLHSTLTSNEQERCRLLPGNALDLVHVVGENSLAGILAANWLHFLEPADVRRAFNMFYKLLRPNGKLCVITCSTRNGLFPDVRRLAAERRANGDKWPGLVVTGEQYKGGSCAMGQQMPERMCLMDPDILDREAKLAGFTVCRVGYIDLGRGFDELRADGQEGSGLLAVKSF